MITHSSISIRNSDKSNMIFTNWLKLEYHYQIDKQSQEKSWIFCYLNI